MGGAGLGTIDGAKLGLQEPLYRWLYGSYERDKVNGDLVQSSFTSPNSSDTGVATYVIVYDISVDENGYISNTNIGGVYAQDGSLGGLGTSSIGHWVRVLHTTNVYVYAHIANVWAGTYKGEETPYFTLDKYYNYTNAHWVKQDGYILNRDRNAYPDSDYRNGVYYSYPKQISP